VFKCEKGGLRHFGVVQMKIFGKGVTLAFFAAVVDMDTP
jgi:hypothetical protein